MRRALAALAAGVSLFALAGCERPLPEVSMQTRTTYVSQPAALWCFTNADAAAGRCRTGDTEPRQVHVREGYPVAIDLPTEVGKAPWFVRLSVPGNPQSQRSPILSDKTHLSLTPTFAGSPQLLVEVVSGRYDGREIVEAGTWRFLLIRQPKPVS
jgi:hypothetical protein